MILSRCFPKMTNNNKKTPIPKRHLIKGVFQNTKIGIFDSGLGGFITLSAIRKVIPQYDYVYFGDTAHVPYGNKNQSEIKKLTVAALKFLFQQNCSLVIIACNTTSAKSLRYIQRVWLPKYHPDKKVLGVIIPTVEALVKKTPVNKNGAAGSVAVMATASTVTSHVYKKEIAKFNRAISVTEIATPQLVPAIESGNLKKAKTYLQTYSNNIPHGTSALILGCTHYAIIKSEVRRVVPTINVISQDEIIPHALQQYLTKHKQLRQSLTNAGTVNLFVSKITLHNSLLVKEWFTGETVQLK